MMKILGETILILTLFCSCSEGKNINGVQKNDSLYLIKSIDSINNWYLIYAIKKDSIYKIVVMKDSQKDVCKRNIMVGKSYHLDLYSRKNEVPEINGIKVKPVNSLDVQCYTYDDATNICIEPSKGVYDLYHTSSIKGLCYVE